MEAAVPRRPHRGAGRGPHRGCSQQTASSRAANIPVAANACSAAGPPQAPPPPCPVRADAPCARRRVHPGRARRPQVYCGRRAAPWRMRLSATTLWPGRSGTSRSVVKRALRLAKRNRHIIVTEGRRRGGRKSLTNVIHIISPEWNTWIRHTPKRSAEPSPSTEGIGVQKGTTTPHQQVKPQQELGLGIEWQEYYRHYDPAQKEDRTRLVAATPYPGKGKGRLSGIEVGAGHRNRSGSLAGPRAVPAQVLIALGWPCGDDLPNRG